MRILAGPIRHTEWVKNRRKMRCGLCGRYIDPSVKYAKIEYLTNSEVLRGRLCQRCHQNELENDLKSEHLKEKP